MSKSPQNPLLDLPRLKETINEARRIGDKCANCGHKIEVTIFRGSGYCSDNCRKALLRSQGLADN